VFKLLTGATLRDRSDRGDGCYPTGTSAGGTRHHTHASSHIRSRRSPIGIDWPVYSGQNPGGSRATGDWTRPTAHAGASGAQESFVDDRKRA
jgi:hypothetical protein